jgi:hypothetical protein
MLESLPERSEKVLGAASDFFTHWLSTVPVTVWLTLGLVIFVSVILMIVIGLVISNFAKASLIAGVAQAHAGQTVTLTTTAPLGLAATKGMIKLSIIKFLASMTLVITYLLLSGLISALLYLVLKPLGILFSIVFFLGLIVLFVVLATIGVYADRLVVLHSMSSLKSFSTGFSYGFKNFFPTLIMAALNVFIGCGFIFLVMALLSFVFILSYLTPLKIILIPTAIALAIPMVIGVILFRALFIVFTYSNWHQIFTFVHDKKSIHD